MFSAKFSKSRGEALRAGAEIGYNYTMKFAAKRSRLLLALMPVMAIAFYTLTYDSVEPQPFMIFEKVL